MPPYRCANPTDFPQIVPRHAPRDPKGNSRNPPVPVDCRKCGPHCPISDRRHFDRCNGACYPAQIEVVRSNALILPIDHAPANLDALDDPLGKGLCRLHPYVPSS